MRLNILRDCLTAGIYLGISVSAAPSGFGQAGAGAEVLDKRQSTCNTATNRQCWTTSPAFNINTDVEASWPSTGVTKSVRQSQQPFHFLVTDMKVTVHIHSDRS
jgi:hypothetical protein